MPNIEIHGLNMWEGKGDGARIMDAIFDLFRGDSLAKEMVITIFPSEVFDIEGKSRPFLRVVNTNKKELTFIANKLQLLGIDIECQVLERFVPAFPNVVPAWKK